MRAPLRRWTVWVAVLRTVALASIVVVGQGRQRRWMLWLLCPMALMGGFLRRGCGGGDGWF